jgi:MFS family permease
VTAEISPRLKRMQWTAVALCTAAIALNYIDRSSLAIGNLKIREEFGITATGIGALQSAWSIAFAIAQLPVGLLVDRIGSRRLLGWGLVLWSAAQAAGGLLTGFTSFLWSRVWLGVFEAPAFPGAVRTVSNWFHPKDRGKPTGFYTIGGDLGRIIGTPVLTGLMLAFGWRNMFVMIGVFGLIGAIAWFALYRDPKPEFLDGRDRAYLAENQVGQAEPVTLAIWQQLFKFRSMWGMILGAVCSGYAIWMYGTWLPGYLEMQHHVSIAKTGFLATVPLMCSVGGALVGGWVTDRLAHSGMGIVESRKYPAACGYVVSAAFCAGAAMSTDLGIALTAISGSMFFLSFAQSGKWTLVTAIAPQSYAASVSSIQNFGSYIGGTISPILTGFVVDKTGSFSLALMIGSGVMIAGALLYAIVVKNPISLQQIEASALAARAPAQ